MAGRGSLLAVLLIVAACATAGEGAAAAPAGQTPADAGSALPLRSVAAAAPLAPAGNERRLSLAEAEKLWRARNRELRLARMAVSGAEADVLTAGQAHNPQLSLNLASISPNEGLGSGGVRDKRMDSIVRLEQLIERGGKRELRVQGAEAALAAVRNDLQDTQRQQRQMLSAVYYELLLAQSRQMIAAETAALYGSSLDAANVRYRAGDLAGADLARLRIEKSRADNDFRQAAADCAKARVNLAYLLGLEREAAALVADDEWPPADFVASGDADLSLRPDIAATAARVLAAEKARDLARSLKKRDVTVGVQIEHNLQNAPLNSFGVGVSVPLFVNYEYEGEIARAEADLDIAREQYERLRAQAQGEVDQARADLIASAERRKNLENGLLADAERVARAAEFAYARGAMGLMDLLDARRTRRQVQLEASGARADHAKAIAAWRAALWSSPVTE
ncbi:TolC family protein [Rhodocyclus tenuis]|uniref:TolC family protein n=1 Tax=Rhodocyclus tenuis TaxID=1066 RepID=UPI0019075232|nr:TolC family protein [Rhodocyclus tenuis]MBK1680066.1 transporter [Rhodocyclus tenuis]